MGFSGQEYWSRLSFPSPSDIPNPGIEPGSPGLSFPSPSDIPNPRIKPGSTGLSFPSPSDVPDPGIEPGSPGLSFPSPSNVPDPGIEPGSPPLQAGSLLLSHQASSFKNYSDHLCIPQNPVPGWSNHLCWQRWYWESAHIFKLSSYNSLYDSSVLLLLSFSRSVVSDSLWPLGLQHTRPPCPHHLLEFAQVHVHCIGDDFQPSHPLTPS